MASPLWMKSQRISFIIIWNITGELHSPKNMTVGSNSPWLVQNVAFHSSPSLICTLLNPHWRSGTVKNSVSQRQVRTSETRGVGVLDHDLVQLPIVLYEVKQTILLLDKEHRGSHGGLGWTDAAICKGLPEEVIKLLLFCRGQVECPGAREFSPRCEINGMVPCLLWWELVKGFLGEGIPEVMVLGQHHVLEGLASLSLLCFLGQPLQWGIHSPNVVFCPLRGDECSINRISGFWSVILHHASV